MRRVFQGKCLKAKYTSACKDDKTYAVVVKTANLEEKNKGDGEVISRNGKII